MHCLGEILCNLARRGGEGWSCGASSGGALCLRTREVQLTEKAAAAAVFSGTASKSGQREEEKPWGARGPAVRSTPASCFCKGCFRIAAAQLLRVQKARLPLSHVTSVPQSQRAYRIACFPISK